jgi:predicted AAA+ superfamily ATPase
MKSRGYNVWVGDNNGKEIDIVAERFGKMVYVQAVHRFTSEEVVEREFGNLERIDDDFPKYVVTLDDLIPGGRRGIECIKLKDFLLSDKF